MDKKKIGKALLFALITVMLMIIYKNIFGRENTILGLVVGMTSYVFIRLDLTSYPIYKSLIFICLNVYLAISSYFAIIDPTIGLFINIINVFSISFIYMREFKSMISYIFLLTYIFMWESPTTLDNLPKRLMGIVLGIFVIILINFIFNKNKFKKSSKNIIVSIVDKLENEVNNLLNENYIINENIQVNKELRKLMVLIDARNSNALMANNKDNIYFNIVFILERLNTLIYSIDKRIFNKDLREDYLKLLKDDLDLIKTSLEDGIFIEDDNKKLKALVKKYKKDEKDRSLLRESVELIRMLKIIVNHLNKYKQNNLDKIYESKRSFSGLIKNKSSWGLRHLGISYSFKLALTVSLAMYIVEIFHLPQGKWIVTTIFVLIQPYEEETVAKAKKRFKGTILGVLIYLIIYTVILKAIPIQILMIILLFLYYTFADYDKKVVCTALLVLSLQGQGGEILLPAIYRFSYVFIGGIIALIVNKYVFPYSKSNIIKDLEDRYVELTENIIKELRTAINQDGFNNDNVFKLMLNCSFLEAKLIGDKKFEDNESFKEFIKKRSKLIREMRFFILLVHYSKWQVSASEFSIDKTYLNNFIDSIEKRCQESE